MPRAMSQIMTQASCAGRMWDGYSSKVLKSGCILGDRVTLEQLSNHVCVYMYTKQERDLLRGMLFDMNALAGRVLVSELARQTGL